MNTSLVAGIVILLIAAAGGAVLIMHQGGSNSHSNTPTITQSQGQETSTENTQSNSQQHGNGGTVDLSGTWQGTFTCRQGTGHFEWIIRKTGEGSYNGVLKVKDCYPTNGYIDIEVTTEGDSITVGTVGGAAGVPAVTFQGKISNGGNHAQGTWGFTNQMDSGSWKADKVSGSTEIPGHTGSETTTTSHTATESQNQGGGGITCTPPPPDDYKTSYQEALNAVIQVIGASNMKCRMAAILGQPPLLQYSVTFDVSGVGNNNLNNLATQLSEAMKSHGWGNVQIHFTNGYLGVSGIRNATLMGHPIGMLALVSVQPSGNNSADLTIQIQPITS